MASIIAWQKGVRSAGVREVIRLPEITTGSSTHSAPAFTTSSLIAMKDVARAPLSKVRPSARLAEQNIQGPWQMACGVVDYEVG